jgi:flagellar protein FliO/FliZ
MTQSLLLVGVFLAVLACLPFALKWLKLRMLANTGKGAEHSKFVSAVAVGPHQSVVTIEAGPEGARVWLTLGVTPQSISCLHVAPVVVSTRESGASLAESQTLRA